MLDTSGIEKRSFIYGQKNIHYNLLYAARKTMEIAVHPDGHVFIKAPLNSDINAIEKKIHKRARWIFRQFNYFKQFKPKTPDRCFITGETHLYLGKQYRLKNTPIDEDCLKLTKGFFHIPCKGKLNPETTKKLMNDWYLQKANIQFNESLNRCWPKFSFLGFTKKPVIAIKQMKRRWGSLSHKGTITLNTNLVKAPKECIDYVVIHELCHLKFPDHNSKFFKLLESLLPGWEKIKHKLELTMS